MPRSLAVFKAKDSSVAVVIVFFGGGSSGARSISTGNGRDATFDGSMMTRSNFEVGEGFHF